MTLIEAWMWTWIYLGMAVGTMTWFIVVAAIFYDIKNRNNKNER